MKAGFGEADITPAVPCSKIGWIKDVKATRILDPLHAKALVLEESGGALGIIALDTLSIRWTQVERIRKGISALGFPGDRVMISTTHNHAGPAVAHEGDVERDEAYLDGLVDRSVAAFRQALDRREEAEVGFGRAVEMGVVLNRRVVYRDGLVRTHGSLAHPDALFVEGPVDPEVAVMAVRSVSGTMLGATVSYALHPTYHGDDECISANWPGVMATRLAARGVPVTLFLQGTQGNMSTGDPLRPGHEPDMETVGQVMAEAARRALEGIRFTAHPKLRLSSEVVPLPYRQATEDEWHGRIRGAQRFVDPDAYERAIPRLRRKIAERGGVKPAQVQALGIDDHVFVGLPGEVFVQLGLAIKERAFPLLAHPVMANGMLGYIPHLDAFKRGGYETTFTAGVDMAPETGDLLVDAAVRRIGALGGS
ncbi:MAG: hypothetical protein AAB152_06895 [Candidatus Coatesbacteria bacterium]